MRASVSGAHSGQFGASALPQRQFETALREPDGFCGFASCVSAGPSTQVQRIAASRERNSSSWPLPTTQVIPRKAAKLRRFHGNAGKQRMVSRLGLVVAGKPRTEPSRERAVASETRRFESVVTGDRRLAAMIDARRQANSTSGASFTFESRPAQGTLSNVEFKNSPRII